MPARTYDDEVFREKRVIKNPIKFKIPLNEEQKSAKETILANTKGRFAITAIVCQGEEKDLRKFLL